MARLRRPAISEQQMLFIDEYLVDFNATAAAERAGYSTKTQGIGTRLLNYPAIMNEVTQRCAKAQKRLELSGDQIRSFHARIMLDPREEADGGPSYIARIMAARELGKLMGLYIAKVHVTGTLTLEDLLLAADKQKRAELPAPTTH